MLFLNPRSDLFINLGNIYASFNQKFLPYFKGNKISTNYLPERLSGLSKNGLHVPYSQKESY